MVFQYNNFLIKGETEMLNSGAQIEGGKDCKPDPEEMLQSARKQKEEAQGHIDRFKEFAFNVRYMERDNELGAEKIAGELVFNLWQAEANEQRWLNEIDKD
jgi:hypothetical protein